MMQFWTILSVSLALGAYLVQGTDAGTPGHHHHHRHHHHHHHHHKSHHQHEQLHRYSVQAYKSELYNTLSSLPSHTRVRGIQVVTEEKSSSFSASSNPVVRADVYATQTEIEYLRSILDETVTIHGKHMRATIHKKSIVYIADSDYDEDRVVAKDREEVAACLKATEGYLLQLDKDDRAYTANAFFDCFRPYYQVLEFFDALADRNQDIVTKYPNASHTFEGRSIPVFKISTSTRDNSDQKKKKKALYTQALIHAREWQAGASTFYTIASILDDLRAGVHHTVKIFDEFDWYFVPIVNIDGYKYSWEVDRMWRTNRDMTNAAGESVQGVDLNRNFGPEEYFNLNSEDVDDETNPGDSPLSEQETAGLVTFIKSIDGLSGMVDMHGYGGLVLRPFSDQPGEPDEPFGSKMKAFGDGIRDALSKNPEVQYLSETGNYLYEAFGCFDDGMFREFNFTVPAITIEVEGDDFVAPQSSIRPVGENIYRGLRQFAKESYLYSKFIEDLTGGKN